MWLHICSNGRVMTFSLFSCRTGTTQPARFTATVSVRMEFFESRHNYVGKYSHFDLETANRYEATLKDGWNEYCYTKRFVYKDMW